MTGPRAPVAIIHWGRCAAAVPGRTVHVVVAIVLLPLWTCGLLAALLGMQAVEGWLERGSSRSDDARADERREG